MTLNNQMHGDDIEGWNEIAMGLCQLKMATEYAQEFSKKLSRYMSAPDKIEIASLNSKYDAMYWKYWEKLIKKIRGI